MRWILLLVLFGTEAPLLAQQKNPIYDSVLAAKLGADDYGMKKYVLVILQTGKKEEKIKCDEIVCLPNIWPISTDW